MYLDNGRRPLNEKIGLALSGGGSRAMAFHLGCLRALHKQGILDRVSTISAVSGGSVIAALYCSQRGDFAAFERTARRFSARGFVTLALKKAVTSLEGIKAVVCLGGNLLIAAVTVLARAGVWLLPFSSSFNHRVRYLLDQLHFERFASRTTILRCVFSDLFNHKTLPQLREDRPKLIVVACELRSKSAFYFTKDGVGSWRLGKATGSDFEIAHAVAASAAYPGLLPPLDEFQPHKGR